MEIIFHGAAREVTGSCHLVKDGNYKILMDCGLIHGRYKDEICNREPILSILKRMSGSPVCASSS